jgi:hypothetical protein
VQTFAEVAQKKGVSLEWELPEPPVTVSANDESLFLIFNNLLHNAVTHTPPGGTVRLSAVAPDKQVAARGELRIETDLPEERFVLVPYFGFTAPAPQQAQPAGASPTGGGGWDANPSSLVPR